MKDVCGDGALRAAASRGAEVAPQTHPGTPDSFAVPAFEGIFGQGPAEDLGRELEEVLRVVHRFFRALGAAAELVTVNLARDSPVLDPAAKTCRSSKGQRG